MVTVAFAYERPTKSKVRFKNDDFGTIYVPNEVFEQLGRPEQIDVTFSTAAAALKAA